MPWAFRPLDIPRFLVLRFDILHAIFLPTLSSDGVTFPP